MRQLVLRFARENPRWGLTSAIWYSRARVNL
jgi:hypothetical protein